MRNSCTCTILHSPLSAVFAQCIIYIYVVPVRSGLTFATLLFFFYLFFTSYRLVYSAGTVVFHFLKSISILLSTVRSAGFVCS